ncbi:MAG: MMPL family transporter [Elusimicrobia bacterium]|nr:MMPL family transporter [Elusimicrobiota bacterium]
MSPRPSPPTGTTPSVPWRDRFSDSAARFISSRAGWVVLGTLLFVGFFSAFLPRVTPKNDSYDFVIDRDPATDFFNKFRKIFEKDEFFVIAYREPNLFTEPRLRELKELTESLENVEGVTDVVSLSNVADMRGTEDSFEADDFLHEIPTSPSALAALRRRALANPLYDRTLLSPDGQTTAIVVFTPLPPPGSDRDIEKEIRVLLGSVNKILAPYRERGRRFAVAGWPVTTFYMGEYMKADARLFFPISLFLTLVTIWFVFRNVRLLFVAGLGIVLTLMATLGLAGLAKITINNASIAVVPLVMALALSDIIHIFTHLDRRSLDESGGHPGKALGRVLKIVLFPCLLTSVNTGIGFFSYTFNSVLAIRSFGWLAATGMMFEFIVTFGFVAPLLTFFRSDRIYRSPEAHQEREIPRLLRWVHGGVTRHPWWPFLLCLAGLVWGGWFTREVKVNTNLEELFNSKSLLRQDTNFVRDNLAGIEAVSIVFESTRDAFKNPALLGQIDAIGQEIKANPRIHSLIGLGEYFKEMNKAFHAEDPAEYRLPKNQRMLEQFLLLYGRDDLKDYITPAFDTTRVMIRASAPSSNESRDLVRAIQEVLDHHPIAGVTATVTGSTALSVRTMKVMVDDQINNIGQTVIVIWLIMVGVLRSWGLALLFLLPNLFPIVINFGLMGFFGIPLDSGTSLIAASAFGIIVDDTVHFFVTFGAYRKRGFGIAQALEATTFEKGEAAVASFFIMVIAFGVLTLSHFQPILMFGLLNIFILVVGMVGDQVFLKSIITLWAHWLDWRDPSPSLVAKAPTGEG